MGTFHQHKSELHGITVVVETTGPLTYVGRYDSQDQHGVHMLDVGIHQTGVADVSKDEYIKRSIKFGIRSDHKHLVVPSDQVLRVTRLGDVV